MEPIDADTPYSPGWWLKTLATQLHNRRVGRQGRRRFSRQGVEASRVRPGLELLTDYLRGDPPLSEAIHSGWAAPFRQAVRVGRMNVAPLVVSSYSNRMSFRDFRTAAADDDLGDIEARKLMRANKLRLVAREVHDTMLGLGDGYTIVTPPDETRSYSLITAESPMQCITAHDAATGRALAGLKMFRDEWDAADWAYLFLPGEVRVARADVGSSTLFTGRQMFELTGQWEWDTDRFETVPEGRVAMVRFANKDGLSEIEGYLDTFDRINDKLFNEWWIGKIQAFRQRALQMPDEDESDPDFDDAIAEEIDRSSVEQIPDVSRMSDAELSSMFSSAPDAFWTLPAGAKIWESQQTDVRMLVDSIKAELEWLAAMKSMPLHTITPDAADGSAEGASTMKEEHTFTVEDRIDRADSGWAETMSMAFLFQGDNQRSEITQLEPIWAPTQRHSLTERSQAARQLFGILPIEAIFTDILEYSPADVVERLRGLQARDLLSGASDAAAAAPVPTPLQSQPRRRLRDRQQQPPAQPIAGPAVPEG